MKIKRFTLVEMLVVISIISILTSILLPAIQKARSKGINAVCISNLKQIGTGNQIYSTDEDGSFLMGLEDSNNNGSYNSNADTDHYENALALIFDYSVKTFECPGFHVSNFQGNNDKKAVVDDAGNQHFAYRTYRPNNFRFYNLPTSSDGRWKNGLIKWNYSLKYSAVANDTILDGDYVRQLSYSSFGNGHYWDRRGASFGNHENQSSNLVFVDGSVKTFKVNSFLSNPGLLFGSNSEF